MGEQVRSVAIACQGGGSHTAFRGCALPPAPPSRSSDVGGPGRRRDHAALRRDAEMVSADPFPRVDASRDPEQTRAFVTAHLCDSIRIDPVRKRIAEDRVTWSIRMRTNGTVIEGRAEAEIGSGGISSLRPGPDVTSPSS